MDKVTIKIPRPLYNTISQVIQDTGFSSVTDFIVWVLRDVVSSGSIEHEGRLSRTEIEAIRRRLESLGYL